MKKFCIPLLLLAAAAIPASAQPVRRPGLRAAVVLARMAVGEAGWRAHEGEAQAMWWVLEKRRRSYPRMSHLRLTRVAHLYSAALRRPSRRWLHQLDAEGRRPPSLRGASWEQRRPLWLATVALAEAWLRGEVEDPCPSALHWGAASDGRPRGFERATCSAPMRNRFWQKVVAP